MNAGQVPGGDLTRRMTSGGILSSGCHDALDSPWFRCPDSIDGLAIGLTNRVEGVNKKGAVAVQCCAMGPNTTEPTPNETLLARDCLGSIEVAAWRGKKKQSDC